MGHIHEAIDFTVDAFIVHDNKVLLRVHDKYGIWLSIGGHIELDEGPIEAIHREVLEEAGLTINLLDTRRDGFRDHTSDLLPPYFVNRHAISKTHEHISFVYIATTDSPVIKPDERETPTEFRWFTKEELLDPQYKLRPNVQYYASRALAEVAAHS